MLWESLLWVICSMRLHVLSLPHTQVTKEFNLCAYTDKVRKFCNMMTDRGHEVFLYAPGEKTDARCTEHISTLSTEEQQGYFGSVDWKKDFFPIVWDANLDYWKISNARTITEITKRKEQKDIICVIAGVCQKPVADAFPNMQNVEFGIGYEGVFSNNKVFESYAHMHFVYGILGKRDGVWFDSVIPNYFDPSDFEFSEEKEDYYLYIGRLVRRKGVEIASEVCKKLGKKLKIAGQGVVEYVPGKKLVTKEFTLKGDHFEYVGTVNIEERSKLMKNAKAVFLPTHYLEPFGGTSIEPLFCGTPTITTDWGAFSENIIHGKTGFRARTMGEFLHAAKNVDTLDKKEIYKYALENFSTDRVSQLYEAYFRQVLSLWDENGFYSEDDYGVKELGRYKRTI